MRRRALAAIATGVVLIGLTGLTLNATLTLRPLPTIDGHFRFLGLHERAEVARDGFGVPRIEANNAHDLFFLQGYVTAQDRFAQMEAMRAEASGFAAESREALARLTPQARDVVVAYAGGVSKFIEQHASARALPAAIALSGATPARWAPEDPIAIALANIEPSPPVTCLVVGSERSLRGRPLVAASYFSNVQHPGMYEIGLEARPIRAIGLSVPGVPGVLAGHNGSVAWTFQGSAYPADGGRMLEALLLALRAGTAAELIGEKSALTEGPIAGCAADVGGGAGAVEPYSTTEAGITTSAPLPLTERIRASIGGTERLTVEDLRPVLGTPGSSGGAARIVIDLGDLDATKAALSTGQSAHPASRHYGDQRQLWEAGQLHRLAGTRERIARVEGVLVLRPR